MADQTNATTTEQEEINLYTWDDVSFGRCCVIFCCVLPNTILCVAQVMDICDKMAEIIAAKDEEVVELEKTVAARDVRIREMGVQVWQLVKQVEEGGEINKSFRAELSRLDKGNPMLLAPGHPARQQYERQQYEPRQQHEKVSSNAALHLTARVQNLEMKVEKLIAQSFKFPGDDTVVFAGKQEAATG